MEPRGTFCNNLPYFSLDPDVRVRDQKPQVLFTVEQNSCILKSGRVWIGHDKGSILEGNVQVYAQSRDGAWITCLGEAYLHKHTPVYAANDYFEYWHLALDPIQLDPGDVIWAQRDVHNISTRPYNMFDIEARVNVLWNFGWFW